MNLFEIRKKLGKSQEDMARAFKVTLRTYWRWEKGESRVPGYIQNLSEADVLAMFDQEAS